MLEKLSKYILTTIVYYDVMDYPMTTFEIWRHLMTISDQESVNKKQKYNLFEIIETLRDDKLRKIIEEKNGFYFLKGRQNLVEQRIERYKISVQKMKKIKKTLKWLRFLPYVRMHAVAGRMSMKQAEDKSDVDLMIIFRRGKMFTGRFFVTAFLQFLGKRRYGDKIRDRICLNHFLSDDYKVGVKNVFSAHAYAFLYPVYGIDVYKKFILTNDWIRKYKINFTPEGENLDMIRDSFISKAIKNVLENILDINWIEKKMKNWQIEKIKNNPKTQQAGGMILYSDEELAFWPNFEKQGPRIFEEFKSKLAMLTKK